MAFLFSCDDVYAKQKNSRSLLCSRVLLNCTLKFLNRFFLLKILVYTFIDNFLKNNFPFDVELLPISIFSQY